MYGRRAWAEQQMHSNLAALNFWKGCSRWTSWQSARCGTGTAEGRLELALGWHDDMSHSCPACDILSKFQVAKITK